MLFLKQHCLQVAERLGYTTIVQIIDKEIERREALLFGP